uniref:CUB domain-containing protein n=1 Tax=Heterorhabditis bacteriophora TaxID=37862 RepID=A0A1I7X9J6_HETBA
MSLSSLKISRKNLLKDEIQQYLRRARNYDGYYDERSTCTFTISYNANDKAYGSINVIINIPL